MLALLDLLLIVLAAAFGTIVGIVGSVAILATYAKRRMGSFSPMGGGFGNMMTGLGGMNVEDPEGEPHSIPEDSITDRDLFGDDE